jgi:hypothetical protein
MNVTLAFQQQWEKLKLKHLQKTQILYMDEGIMEMLRWNFHINPLEELIGCGISDVRLLKRDEEGIMDEKELHNGGASVEQHSKRQDRATLVIWSAEILYDYIKQIERIIHNESCLLEFLEVVILTSIHVMIYKELAASSYPIYKEDPFGKMKETLLKTLPREKSKNILISIENIIALSKDVLIFPSREYVFPHITDVDARHQRLYHLTDTVRVSNGEDRMII